MIEEISGSSLEVKAAWHLGVAGVLKAYETLSPRMTSIFGGVKSPFKLVIFVRCKIPVFQPKGVECTLGVDWERGGPTGHSLSDLQIVQFLIEEDKTLPPIVRELTKTGKKLVPWAELGFSPNLRDKKELFIETVGKNAVIKKLAECKFFDPNPFPWGNDRYFILTPSECEDAWRDQLRKHIKACQEPFRRKKK